MGFAIQYAAVISSMKVLSVTLDLVLSVSSYSTKEIGDYNNDIYDLEVESGRKTTMI